MTESLEQALADERENAAVLRRNGYAKDARIIERICQRVHEAAEDYVTFIPEADAMLRSGNAREWLRNRFPAWEREGLARWNPTGKKQRQYRRCIVPRRANTEAARADAMREAEKDAKATA